MVFSKRKAISPVVATALLLVVAVTAVVGFSGWFSSYQSGINSDVEDNYNNINSNKLSIDTLVGGELYVNNQGDKNSTINSVQINGIDCGINNKNITGAESIDISACLKNFPNQKVKIIVQTDNGVVQKTLYYKKGKESIDCSSLNGSWIKVPENSIFKTSDFCVMKYEAKDINGVAKSILENTPWANINQIQARQECTNLGDGYHLITNSEWMTIARNIEKVSINWNTKTVGDGYIYSGHNDNNPSNALSASTDEDGYFKTLNSGTDNQKRTLKLSNGETIWDFSGNLWEWNNETYNTNEKTSLGTSSNGFYQWNSISGYENLKPKDLSLTSANGIGTVYATQQESIIGGGDISSCLRSGGYSASSNTGIFSLNLHFSPLLSDAQVGFRCTYSE